MNKEIDFKNKVVYVAGSKRMFGNPMFNRAIRYFTSRCTAVRDPRGMYRNNQEWLDNYEKDLSICDVMIIVADNSVVGKGVYIEYQHFRNRFCKCYHYFEQGGMVYLMEVKKLEIVDEDDWKEYAVITY